MYKNLLKPIIDFVFGLLGLLMVSPILLIITLFLCLSNNCRPFFFQTRPGKNGKLFRILKFKTMTDEKGEDGKLLPDEKRLTKIGKIIRLTSLDELPQLLNVIKGDMSFIGPRPLLPEYLPYYTQEESIRHNVKPGITGLAQVLGRNNLPWNDRLKLDVKYVKNISFKEDIYIFQKTVRNVVMRKDVIVVPGINAKRLDDERRENV